MFDSNLMKGAVLAGATAVIAYMARELTSEREPAPVRVTGGAREAHAFVGASPPRRRRKKNRGGGKPATGMFKSRDELERRVIELFPERGKFSAVAREVGTSDYVVKQIVAKNGLMPQAA